MHQASEGNPEKDAETLLPKWQLVSEKLFLDVGSRREVLFFHFIVILVLLGTFWYPSLSRLPLLPDA